MITGIINQTRNAKEQTEIADEKERIDLSTVGAVGKEPRGELKRNYFNEELTEHIGEEGKDYSLSESEELPFIVEYLDSKRSYLVDGDGNITGPLKKPEETEETETGGTTFTMENGVIEVKWLAGNTNYAIDTPNVPTIKENLPEGTTMELVKYEEGENGEEGDWVSGTDYNYIAGTGTEDNNSSRWANARVTIDGVDSYFVWIPRYAYRIVYFADEESKKAYMEDNSKTDGIVGYSDSRGIVDKNGKRVNGVTSYKSVNVGDYFMPHPAFTDNLELGGWNENIEGIWVGKYLTTTTKATINQPNYNTSKIQVKPGKNYKWDNSINEKYERAKNFSINLNSHMLKNSEWGAVAYLTESKYGRNGIEINRAGASDITGSAEVNNELDTEEYWSDEGSLASTTGNVTGIYDMSNGGGYVAAYRLEGTNQDKGSLLIEETNKKFVNIYIRDDSYSYMKDAYKIGDATYETNGWHNDTVLGNTTSTSIFMTRGNYMSNDIEGSGIFSYNYGYGGGFGSSYLSLIIK